MALIILIQTMLVKDAFAHFSTPSFQTATFSHKGISHSDAPLSTQAHNTPAFVSKGNPNLYTRDRADEFRYRNANFKSRCLHLENKDPNLGTQNLDIPNMRMKFENPTLRNLNFNAE